MIPTSRRQFLRTAGLAGTWSLLGFPSATSWAARRAPKRRLRLVFFTDVHALPDAEVRAALTRAATAINAERPDLVIGGGDLIYDGFELAAADTDPLWDAYMAFQGAINAPVEPILGNHDLVAVRPSDGSEPIPDPRSVFRHRLGLDRTWRVVDAGGYRIFLLDSVVISDDELMYHGGISAPQLEWLASELDDTDADTPVVVVTHIPFLSAIPQATKGAITPLQANQLVVNNREVLELFAGHNLLLVLQGHLHAEETLRWRGTTFITNGAICGDKWRGPKYGTPAGFGVVTLRPDRVDWEYKTYG
jgi:Icc protein